MDHFGLNSLFWTITPDDECSFRVRLYADPDNKVRHRQLRQKERLYSSLILFYHHKLPNVGSYGEQKIDSGFRKHIHTTYPGSCSLEYQQAIEIFINCMLNWDLNKQQARGKGIFRTVLTFAPAHKAVSYTHLTLPTTSRV